MSLTAQPSVSSAIQPATVPVIQAATLPARLPLRRSLWALALLSISFSFACDDTAVAPRERQIFVEVNPNDIPLGGAQTGGGTAITQTRVLVPAGDVDKELPINGEIELGVLLFDQEGSMVSGEQVAFEILTEEGAPLSEASLSAQRTVTDASGYARVTFYAGPEVRDYRVQASHREAGQVVTFEVSALDLPSGDINVRFDYQGPIGLDQVEVYLVPDPSWCDVPYYLAPPDSVRLSQNGLGVSDRFQARGLLAGERYSVVARARSSEVGTLAAGGCTGDIRVVADETRDVIVSLLLLPVDPSGQYDVINHYDFTDAIPGRVGEVINGLVRFFGDANNEREIAGVIFDVVEQLAREAAGSIGGLVINLISNWVEDDLNNLINRYIDEDGPEWVRSFFTIGSDLISVVSNMEVLSEMRFTKARSDGTFDGSQSWVGLAFYWRLNCEDGDAECGRYDFTMDDVVEGASGIGLVFGQFDGRVHSYNQGVINMHTMDLQYGRLILFVLNELILPRVAGGATSLSEALVNLANCPGFASRLTGGRDYLRLGGINIVSRGRIEQWCTSAMSTTGTAANYLINGLEVDTRMDLQGELTFVEESDDLVVDRLTEGSWWGSIRTSEEAAPPFSGDFAGERRGREAAMELSEE